MNNPGSRIALALAVVACAAQPGAALALSYDYGDWLFNVDTSLTAAMQWRTESRDKQALDDPLDPYRNLDDGNNNFDPGLVSAKGSFILELGAVYGDLSFFLRSDGLYDYVYENKNSDMSARHYATYNGAIPNGGQVQLGDYPKGTLDEHGQRLRLLEAFVNYQFELGERLGSLRVGSQLIAWGEATIYQGVNTMQNPIDGGVALSPGVEAKEIFLPTPAVDLKYDLTDGLSAEAYYKLKWAKTTQPGVGSFLSTSDFTGPGAQRILLGSAGAGEVRSADKPGNGGQWGAALRYLTEGGTNFTLSYNNNHANAPGSQIVFDPLNGSYTREVYLKDIEFWQFSVATNLGEALVYADFAYSDNAPFIDQTRYLNERRQLVAADVSRATYRQLVVGMTDVYTAFPWLSRQIALTAELLYQDNSVGEGDKTGTPYIATDDAWGYQALAILKYFSVLPGMDVDVTLSFRQDVDGYGSAALKNNLIEGQKWASLGFNAVYLTNWEFAAKYSFYFGNDDRDEPVLSDRDNLALSVKYKF
ncbi:DUF1302 domain-containing protein [Haliea sp. E17]|uniref:DUF1302 domain-containing protein n=1 Tax=Haliea sp. E17 TaxID=3401576 RepID=UPI003AAC2E5D